jgi:hypothetical protein
MQNTIKIQLRLNPLTDDRKEYMAVALPQGHMKPADIIDELVAEGTEFARETLIDIIDRYNRLCAKYAVTGYDVDTGLLYLRAVVKGIFHDTTYDPAKNHLYVSATQSKALREAIARTTIEIIGEIPKAIQIFQVENMFTHQVDGTLLRGRNALITGSQIKIAGNQPEIGLYLIAPDGTSSYKLPDNNIVTNNPSSILFLVPDDLPEGPYHLKIITQFGKTRLLTTPREATYRIDLTLN